MIKPGGRKANGLIALLLQEALYIAAFNHVSVERLSIVN